ncbi:hypothetical protein [Rhizobium leguminosarum]
MPEATDDEHRDRAVISWAGKLKKIIGTPVAPDGGSLALEVEQVGGDVKFLILNRSIAARGTDAFETLSSERGMLSSDEVIAIIDLLEHLPIVGENADVGMVENFVTILKRKYQAAQPKTP